MARSSADRKGGNDDGKPTAGRRRRPTCARSTRATSCPSLIVPAVVRRQATDLQDRQVPRGYAPAAGRRPATGSVPARRSAAGTCRRRFTPKEARRSGNRAGLT